MAGAIYGVSQNDDLAPGILKKDTRPTSMKFKDFLREEAGMFVQVVGIMMIAASFYTKIPFIQDAFLVFILIVYWMHSRIKFEYDFFAPSSSRKNGVHDPGEGMFFLSNNIYTGNTEAWISKSLGSTHWLVFGSTGSGKTRFLLGVFYQVAMYGGGCIYVDGKGDNTVWWLFYSMARKVGREEDVLLMNYLTGGGKIDPSKRISNTCNPFTTGNANQLASIVVGLMRDGGGDDMWKGRAVAMLKSLMHALCDKRDRNEIELSIEEIRNHMTLDKIITVAQDDGLEQEARKSIMHYLEELPGFRMDDMFAGKLNAECYKQHGFLQMQLTEVMGDLSSTYKHIYGGKYGEIDFTDVIFQKRLLFVILPALEKNPDELAGLGKMVVSNIRSALAPALGIDVEGNKVDVLDSKPTNAEIPFTIILDEYGYYAVEGFAVVAAQARSLGVQVIYAAQDYPSLKKGSEIEAQATEANTNIKIAMKIEDLRETADLFVQRAGESDITVKSGDEQKTGMMGGYKEQDTTRVERRKRIDGRDLVSQKPGQAHVLVGDKLERVQLFYADPVETENIRINRFIPTKRISSDAIKEIKKSRERIDKIFSEGSPISVPEQDDETIQNLFAWSKLARSYDLSLEESMQFALGANMAYLTIDDLDKEPPKQTKKASPAEEKPTKTKVDMVANQSSNKEGNKETASSANTKDTISNQQTKTSEQASESKDSGKPVANEEDVKISTLTGDGPSTSVSRDAEKAKGDFIELLDEAVKENLKRHYPSASDEQISANSVESQLLKINNGREGHAKEVLSELKGVSRRYPGKPTPSKPIQEDLEKHLKWIMEHLSEDDVK